MHVIQDTGYQSLVAHGDFLLDHFRPALVRPILPYGNLMYKAYYQFKREELSSESIQLGYLFSPPASTSAPSIPVL